jgi:hypothetical protein
MKWVLVVLIGGVNPIATDITFEKLADCLAAEQQLRQKYVDAYDTLNQQTKAADPRDFGRHRRRDSYRAREIESRRLANTGTCIPHAGTDKPFASLDVSKPDAPPQPAPPTQAPAKE